MSWAEIALGRGDEQNEPEPGFPGSVLRWWDRHDDTVWEPFIALALWALVVGGGFVLVLTALALLGD